MSPFVQDFELLTKLDSSCIYDLSGIINHYGSLTFGHYTATVKNPYDGQWFKYDDQNRVPIREESIAKDNAYILFYTRRDTEAKTISELMPNISEVFSGRPIRTTGGQEGYVIGKKPDSSQSYLVKIDEEILVLNIDDLHLEVGGK